MAANTITEIIGDKAEIEVEDGKMILNVANPSDKTVVVLEGFRLHIKQLAEDYSKSIKTTNAAVKNRRLFQFRQEAK